MRLTLKAATGGVAVLLLLGAVAPGAQANSRTQLQDVAFPAPGYHTVSVRAVVDPGGQVAPHTHPGVEMGYVVSGRASLHVQGSPPRDLKDGDSFAIAPGQVHFVVNAGPGPLTLVSTYVVRTGQPVLIPVKGGESGAR